ncbi:MAG: hypothetical protein ABII64_00320 [Elusimicrobiota bacterium]
MRYLIFLLSALILLAPACNKRLLVGGGWYEYGPMVVELTGTLEGEVKGMGGTEEYRLIKLENPINVKERVADGSKKETNVTWIQLLLNFAAVEFISESADQKVRVKGTLFHTPGYGQDTNVGMKVNEIKTLK